MVLMGTYSTGPGLDSCAAPTWKPLDLTQNLNLAFTGPLVARTDALLLLSSSACSSVCRILWYLRRVTVLVLAESPYVRRHQSRNWPNLPLPPPSGCLPAELLPPPRDITKSGTISDPVRPNHVRTVTFHPSDPRNGTTSPIKLCGEMCKSNFMTYL